MLIAKPSVRDADSRGRFAVAANGEGPTLMQNHVSGSASTRFGFNLVTISTTHLIIANATHVAANSLPELRRIRAESTQIRFANAPISYLQSLAVRITLRNSSGPDAPIKSSGSFLIATPQSRTVLPGSSTGESVLAPAVARADQPYLHRNKAPVHCVTSTIVKSVQELMRFQWRSSSRHSTSMNCDHIHVALSNNKRQAASQTLSSLNPAI